MLIRSLVFHYSYHQGFFNSMDYKNQRQTFTILFHRVFKMRTIYLIALFTIAGCEESLLKKFQVCPPRKDLNIDKCLQGAIQNAIVTLKDGIPELNIPPMEPLRVPVYSVIKETYEQTYTDMDLYGQGSAVISDVTTNITDSEVLLSFKAFIPNLTTIGNYVYKNLTIGDVDYSSSGRYTFTSEYFSFTLSFWGEIEKRDGVDYVVIRKVRLTDISEDGLHYEFESEKPDVGKQLGQLLNDNWRMLVTTETGKYARLYEEAYQKKANSILSRVPFRSIFPKA